MLPSKGYFKSLNCPYHQSSYCNRPHCHFRHTRRDDIFDSSSFSGVKAIGSPPREQRSVSYKPTPIAELKKRHLPVNSIPSAAVSPTKRRTEPYNVKYTRRAKEEYTPESRSVSTAVYKATKISDRPNPKVVKSGDAVEDNVASTDPEDEEETDEDIDLELVKKELSYIGKLLKKFETNQAVDLSDLSGETSTSEPSSEESAITPASDEKPTFSKPACNGSVDNKSCEKKTIECSKISEKDIKSNHKISSSNHKRKVDVNKTTKSKDKGSETITDLFDVDLEIKKDEPNTQNHHHSSSSRKSGKENKHSHSTSSSSERTKKDSEHSKKDTQHSKKGSEHSKSNSDHRHSSSSTSKSKHVSSSTQSSSKDSAHKSSSKSSKKDSNVISSSDKDKSKTKHKSSRSESSRSSSKHTETKNRTKESRDKERHKSSSSSSSKRRRESKSAHESDDEIEIISDNESIIVIDSDDEKEKITRKENNSSCDKSRKRGKRDESESREIKRRRHSMSRSPSRSPSPCLPSDVSSSDEELEQTTQSSVTVTPAATATELDMRVMSKLKSRVSLGNVWRPQNNLKKPVKILTPAERLMQFRKMTMEIENSDSNAKPKISGVPNVQSLLLEKQRLTASKAKLTFEEKKILYYQRRNMPIPEVTNNEDKHPEPLLNDTDGKPLKGAKEQEANSLRDTGMKKLWSRFRNLVVPGDSFLKLQKKCQVSEVELYKSSNGDSKIYYEKIRDLNAKVEEKIPKFTQEHFRHIVPPESKLFPPELNNGKGKKVSLYSEMVKLVLSEETLFKEGYPRKRSDYDTTGLCEISTESILRWNSSRQLSYKPRIFNGEEYFRCTRCFKDFQVDPKTEMSSEECFYHNKTSKKRDRKTVAATSEPVYWCCDQTEPCQSSEHHSRETRDHTKLEGFVETPEPRGPMPPDGWGIFALDCEMYYSVDGLELGRVSVVNSDRRCVYDAYVKNEQPVTDYCFSQSGLTSKLLQEGLDFERVRDDLFQIINSKTILIGHSLDNDLKVLKILHKNVVDTSVLYKPSKGIKERLQSLAHNILKWSDFQNGESGHSSIDDAEACMMLVLLEVLKKGKKSVTTAPPRMKVPASCKSKNIFET